MRLPMNFGKKGGAEARRWRKVKRRGTDEGVLKRKRTRFDRDSGFVPPPLPPHIINQERLVFVFCKKLQQSDVGNLRRIVLPKRLAEAHLPQLLDKESIILPVIDMDGAGAWTFKFRYWSNNYRRIYVFEGTGPFTRNYRLQTGDYMLIYRDTSNWNYMIRGVKASEVEAHANKEVVAAVEGDNADTVVPKDDVEGDNADTVVQNDDAKSAPFDVADNSANLPKMESLPGTSSTSDEYVADDSANLPKMESLPGTSSASDEYSYFNDILNSFCSWDEIKDYYCTPTR